MSAMSVADDCSASLHSRLTTTICDLAFGLGRGSSGGFRPDEFSSSSLKTGLPRVDDSLLSRSETASAQRPPATA